VRDRGREAKRGYDHEKAGTYAHQHVCPDAAAATAAVHGSKPIRLPSAAAASNRSSVSQLDSKAIWPQSIVPGCRNLAASSGHLARIQDSKQNLVEPSGLAYFPTAEVQSFVGGAMPALRFGLGVLCRCARIRSRDGEGNQIFSEAGVKAERMRGPSQTPKYPKVF